jgi:hypothetical protein
MSEAPVPVSSPPAAPAAPASPNAPPSQAAPATPTRPDYVPETFWDATANAIKPEFGTHFTEIATFHKTETEKRAALAARKAEDIKFEVKLPETVKVPDGMQIKLDDKDARLPLLRDIALKHGLDQDTVNDLVALDAQMKIAEHTQSLETFKAEDAKLGDNAKPRKEAVGAFLKGLKESGAFTAEEYDAIRPLDAAGVTAFEKLIKKLNGAIGTGGNPPSPPKPGDVPIETKWYGTQQKAS